MVSSPQSPWPDQLEVATTAVYLLIVVTLPALGYVYMVADFRAYLRRFRRVMIQLAARYPHTPGWVQQETPPVLVALGLRLPCTESDVLCAYRRQVKQLHPDRGGSMRKFLRMQAHFEEAIAFIRQWQRRSDIGSERFG